MGKGAPLFLNGYLSCHILAFILATTEPENWPREPFSVPMKGAVKGGGKDSGTEGHGVLAPPPPKKKSDTQKVPFFLRKKWLSFLKKNMHLFV